MASRPQQQPPRQQQQQQPQPQDFWQQQILVHQVLTSMMCTGKGSNQDQGQMAEIGKRSFLETIAATTATAVAAVDAEHKRLGHARFMQHRAMQQQHQVMLQQLQQQVQFPVLPQTQPQPPQTQVAIPQQQPAPTQPSPTSPPVPQPVAFDPALIAQALFPPPVLPPPPKHRTPGIDRERDITSCRFWTTLAQVKKEQNLDEFFQKACATPEFAKGWVESGFQGPTFYPNNKLSWERKKKFLDALEELPDDSCLGVVFHGTSSHNIDPILQEGLDPTKRRGQGYGPGEYFSKEPSVSVSYCKGGLEMLVFVVVLPSTLPLKEEDKQDDEQRETTVTARSRPCRSNDRISRTVPPYFVVVENNAHQMPIGTVQFESVDGSVITESQRKANKLRALNKKFQEAAQAAKETKLKAEIIQNLISYKVEMASEKYQKNCKALSETSKREIAWYVHQRIDEDVIFCYFEDLPKPMDQEEFLRANIPSVDQTLENEVKAKDDLAKAKTEENQIPWSGNSDSSSMS